MMNSEPVNLLTAAQDTIWQTVSATFSEAVGAMVTYDSSSVSEVSPLTVAGEINQSQMVIQMAFSGAPESQQLLLIPQDLFLAFASAAAGSPISTVDDNIVADMRPVCESLVQGLCLGVSNARGEQVMATGVTLRYQIPDLPENLQHASELLRVTSTMSIEGLNGNITWLMDEGAVSVVLGTAATEAPVDSPVVTATDFGAPSASAPAAVPASSPSGGSSGNGGSLDLLLDIPLEISVELGRLTMLVRDVVELGAGDIVEIDKAAGEPVEILVNGRHVARGEVVVIEDNFGVRITEILSPQDRLNRLNGAA